MIKKILCISCHGAYSSVSMIELEPEWTDMTVRGAEDLVRSVFPRRLRTRVLRCRVY